MKNMLLLLGSLLWVLPVLSADTRSTVLLKGLSEKIRSMEGYVVEFEVLTSDRTIGGRYFVRGDAYYMSFGAAQVFSDGLSRWEVDPDKKEVVIDVVDTASRNILNNPTRAFDLIDGGFSCDLVGESSGKATVRLVPVSADTGITTLELTLDTSSLLPLSVAYDLDGERVEVVLSSFRPSAREPDRFHASDYPGYELIDFR